MILFLKQHERYGEIMQFKQIPDIQLKIFVCMEIKGVGQNNATVLLAAHKP